ncbi:MAG: formylglycine-generating enzyme family protein, partial [Gemmataceae bacterium]|nr:formylglycine-generating enzyme family protein [Gemmataceae bacterium]
PEVSVRRALLLGLGAYNEELAPGRRQQLTEKLLRAYRGDPDPGLHAAAEWMLGRWGRRQEVKRIDSELMSKNPLDKRQWYVNQQGHTMVVIHPKEFLMGSPGHEAGRSSGELLHRVRIPRSIAVATKKVTVEQFRRFLEAHPKLAHVYIIQPSGMEPTPPDGPITMVTWANAIQYCQWLSEQEGIPEDQWCYPALEKQTGGPIILPDNYLSRAGYRLLTEAEWEYACRAGAVTSRFYGDDEELLREYARHYLPQTPQRLWPVGTLKPNDFGLFDMLGNGGEWCQSGSRQYVRNPWGRPAVDRETFDYGQMSWMRGAQFDSAPWLVRSANRTWFSVGASHPSIGFRVAKTLPPNED